jgi:hypothetical protein
MIIGVNAALGPGGRDPKALANVPAGDPKRTTTVRPTLDDGAQGLAVFRVTDILPL